MGLLNKVKEQATPSNTSSGKFWTDLSTDELVYLFRYGQRIAFQILKTSRIVPEPEIAAQEIASTSYYKCLESNAAVRNFKAYYSTVIRRESNKLVNKYHRILGLDWNTSHSNPTLEFEDKEQQIILNKKLHQALGKLKPRQKKAIMLFYFRGFSGEEIAAELDASPNAVYELLRRARRKLQDELGPNGINYLRAPESKSNTAKAFPNFNENKLTQAIIKESIAWGIQESKRLLQAHLCIIPNTNDLANDIAYEAFYEFYAKLFTKYWIEDDREYDSVEHFVARYRGIYLNYIRKLVVHYRKYYDKIVPLTH